MHTTRRVLSRNGKSLDEPVMCDQAAFLGALRLEQRRTERSGKMFALMLLEFDSRMQAPQQRNALVRLAIAASQDTRETDLTGWYKDNSILGIIFTEIDAASREASAQTLLAKINTAASAVLTRDEFASLNLALHVFPDPTGKPGGGTSANAILFPPFAAEAPSKKVSLLAKRVMDIAGSLFALALSSPLLIAAAITIKLTSKGPVFFRQERIGQFGRKFTCLKLRSMTMGNNQAVHEEFVRNFIAGESLSLPAGKEGVYKLTTDARVTKIGKLLRRTSMDEIPQFFNVLTGDMSLVGPRPPIQYEVQRYDLWHKRRYLTVKPGITGLWQVTGRSRIKFDDMVRLDLKYARTWSLWLDIKILLRTPHAVLIGDGAF